MEKSIGILLILSAITLAASSARSYRYAPAGRIYRQPPVGMRHRKFAGKVEPYMTQEYKSVPAKSIYRKPFYLPAKSIHSTVSQGRRAHLRQVTCPTIRHRDILSVARESLARINEKDGGDILAIKRIARPGIRRCKKCTNGLCVFDHLRVTATLLLAPECKSGICECGVERDAEVKTCHISGWTKPGRLAYNIQLRCDDASSGGSGVELPASRLPVRPTTSRRPVRPRATTTTTTTEGPTTTTLPIVTFPPDFDVDAGGRGDRPTEPEGSGFRPAPALNGETDVIDDGNSEPAPLSNVDDKDLESEELLQ